MSVPKRVIEEQLEADGRQEGPYVKGAFYWVRCHGEPTVAKCFGYNPALDGVEWLSVDWARSKYTDELDEVGLYLGKDPG